MKFLISDHCGVNACSFNCMITNLAAFFYFSSIPLLHTLTSATTSTPSMNLLNDCMFSYAIHAGILTLCEYLGRKITNQTETWNDQEIIRFLYFQANKTDELRSNPFQTGGQYSNPMFNPQKAGPKNNNVSILWFLSFDHHWFDERKSLNFIEEIFLNLHRSILRIPNH